MKKNKLALLVFLVIVLLLLSSPVFSQIGFRFGGGVSLPIASTETDIYINPGVPNPTYDLGVYFNLKDFGLLGLDFMFNVNFLDPTISFPNIQLHIDYVHEFIIDNISYGIAGSFGFNYMGPGLTQHGLGAKIGLQIAFSPTNTTRIGIRAYTSFTYARDEGDGNFYVHFPVYIFLAI